MKFRVIHDFLSWLMLTFVKDCFSFLLTIKTIISMLFLQKLGSTEQSPIQGKESDGTFIKRSAARPKFGMENPL